MRLLLPVLICLGTCLTHAQENPAPTEPPRTLEEAHEHLESVFSKDELAKIDAMKSDKEMMEFHLTTGLMIRSKWGLLGGSPLANNLWKLGFSHPDDMVDLILQTFWCRRHEKNMHLEDRADYFQTCHKAAADPPPTLRDPSDQSEIEWKLTLDASTEDRPRKIHVGRSKKTGRWLAYEFNKGLYFPDAALQKRIKAFAEDPFAK